MESHRQLAEEIETEDIGGALERYKQRARVLGEINEELLTVLSEVLDYIGSQSKGDVQDRIRKVLRKAGMV